MKQLNHEIIKTFKLYKSYTDYTVVKVNETIFMCPSDVFEDYIVNCSESHWNKVEKWIDDKLMPYMTRKSINYKSNHSYNLKHTCEKEIKEYTANIQIIYILALKGVKAGGINNGLIYATDFYYPLSSKFDAVRRTPVYRPKFKVGFSR